MITKRVSRCKLCGEEIVTKGTWFNQIFINQLNDWTVEEHLKKVHSKGWMNPRYRIESVLLIIAGCIVQSLMAVLWVITLPAWAVHEFCLLN